MAAAVPKLRLGGGASAGPGAGARRGRARRLPRRRAGQGPPGPPARRRACRRDQGGYLQGDLCVHLRGLVELPSQLLELRDHTNLRYQRGRLSRLGRVASVQGDPSAPS